MDDTPHSANEGGLVGKPGVGIVADAAVLVCGDAITIHEPAQGCAAVDLVAVRLWRNAFEAQVIVHHQHILILPNQLHGAGGE
ncbi:MAG: hypothetical protein F4162_09350, partial [Synechococcus sp. SB0676_bin_10]|nr:hypothetical protein [Synechococcus sp. SB0676_bin_10]